jgi:thiamine phosphate synthase YjbQ (UPF0047 family)
MNRTITVLFFRKVDTEFGVEGPWEQIFYGEFDGNRPKRVLVKVIGE